MDYDLSVVISNLFAYSIRTESKDAAMGTNSYSYSYDPGGGILAGSFSGVTAFYAYDATGNVTDLVGTNGEFLPQYQYDPYGNTIAKSGAMAEENPFRFSTKYTDEETGLLYYGYRYYVPETGRWGSRDPIEEPGFELVAEPFKAVSANANDIIQPVSRLGDSTRAAQPKVKQGLSLSLEYVFIANAQVNLIDMLGLLPGDPYTTPDAAAIAAVAQYVAWYQAVEKGGAVYKITTASGSVMYSYVPTVTSGWLASVNVAANNGQVPAGGVIVGYWHSHTCLGSASPPGGFSQPDQTLIGGYRTGTFWLKDIYHSNLLRWQKVAGQPDVYGLLP